MDNLMTLLGYLHEGRISYMTMKKGSTCLVSVYVSNGGDGGDFFNGTGISFEVAASKVVAALGRRLSEMTVRLDKLADHELAKATHDSWYRERGRDQ